MSNVSQKLNLNLNLFTPKKMIETLLYGNKSTKEMLIHIFLTKQLLISINPKDLKRKPRMIMQKPDSLIFFPGWGVAPGVMAL